MADAVPQSLSGLASILSSEPMPQMPMFRTLDPSRIANEIEQYVRNLHIYLTRLFGRFTATNIITTINQGNGGMGLGFDKIIHKSFHYIGTNSPTIVLDTSYDWRRGLGFMYRVQASTVSAAAVISNPDLVFCGFHTLSGAFTGYPLVTFTYSDTSATQSVDIQTDGSIQTQFNGTSIHQEFWIDIVLAAIVGVEKVSASFAASGNGL